jgi:AraC family transcriptional regulator
MMVRYFRMASKALLLLSNHFILPYFRTKEVQKKFLIESSSRHRSIYGRSLGNSVMTTHSHLEGDLTAHRAQTLTFHETAIARVIQLMRQNPAAALGWDVLSETAGMSRYHFLRVFEEVTHISPHRFLIAIRMEKAKQLLLETSLLVHDVCAQVGYASVGSFTRAFKEFVGMAPGEFRNFAEKLPPARMQVLLERHLDRPKHPPADSILFNADLKFQQPFKGIVFVWIFHSPLRPIAPFAAVRVQESGLVQLALPRTDAAGYFFAVGFPDANCPSQFLIPAPYTPVAISPLSPKAPGPPAAGQTVPLNFRFPSVFDPPLLVCLPMFLLKFAGSDTQLS